MKSFAKINLFLDILSKNEFSYHELFSLFSYIDLADEIIFEKISSKDIIIECNTEFNLPHDFRQNNSLKKAYFWYLTNINPKLDYGLKIKLEKNIPLGAGLGGGSSNAALLLSYLAEQDQIVFKQENITNIAYQIGADIPFFLFNSASYLGGIGEQRLGDVSFPDIALIIVNPAINISTSKIFRAQKSYSKQAELNFPTRFKTTTEFISFLSNMENKLEQTALNLVPELALFQEKLNDFIEADLLRMTGSGSSYFCLFNDSKKRDFYYQKLKQNFPEYFIYSGFCRDNNNFS